MKQMFALGVALLLMLPLSAVAELGGSYAVSGTNPGGSGNYHGTAEVAKTGSTYEIVWNVGRPYTGTGILNGDVLSVAFRDEKSGLFGIVTYRVTDNGKVLQGTWCAYGQTAVGTETLKKN